MSPFKQKLYVIIFEAETPYGKLFDVALLWAIGLSVFAVCLDSVPEYRAEYGTALRIIEWFFTIVFTIEYALRIYAVKKPTRYIFSFFGLVDLFAILPTYLSLFIANSQYLLVIRILRLMRVFRVLKLVRYLGEADVLSRALLASRHKITVFIGGVLSMVVIFGALMHIVEGPKAGFDSIPTGIYWAIVTVTTVGYGDISPITPLGKLLASLIMLSGYGILAVPTGIVSVELSRTRSEQLGTHACPGCGRPNHAFDAVFCKICGTRLYSKDGPPE